MASTQYESDDQNTEYLIGTHTDEGVAMAGKWWEKTVEYRFVLTAAEHCVFRASWTSSSTSLTPCSAPQSVGFFHLPRELPAGLGLLTTHWLG